MKIAVSCLGRTLEDSLDKQFGRTDNFLVVDTDTLLFTVIDNAAQANTGGAGIAAAQLVIDSGADVIITGQLGPNALEVLNNTDIGLYQGISGTVYENIVAFNQKKLTQIASSGPAHAGMGR